MVAYSASVTNGNTYSHTNPGLGQDLGLQIVLTRCCLVDLKLLYSELAH